MTHEEFHEYDSFVHQFSTITSNLWYTWDPEAQKLTDVLLNKANHDQSSFERFHALSEESRQELFRNSHLRASVDHVYRKLQDYLSGPTWFDTELDHHPEYEIFTKNPVAYLCAEYGFTDWLNIYSGGLGILAGDILKEASDLGLPMVAIGLLYQYGYFKQVISEDGYQSENYIPLDPHKLPLKQMRISTGAPLLIEVTIVDHPVYCKIWTAQIGRVPLFLLDTNITENVRVEDRLITGHLYGGDQDTRIRQEIVLGIGGERALSSLGYHPTIFSMNEGHSAFAGLEITKHFMHERGLTFVKAKEEAKTKLIYTNHTLVPAGNDVFTYDLVYKYLSPYILGMSINFEQLYDLGKGCDENGNKVGDTFSMPELAFEMSLRANAVSKQHGDVAKRMWPHKDIIPITNGVHLPTWVHPKMQKLYDAQVSHEWQYTLEDDLLWDKVLQMSDEELWNTHMAIKRQLVLMMNETYHTTFSEDAMTIVWARRFARYKRPDMIFSDIDRLSRIVASQDKPVQIIIAGKAHPKDSDGKNLMSMLHGTIQDPRFNSRVMLLPNYQISLARALVSGSDVWLNTPVPLDEASGTSGMKSAANGILQLSTNGGWMAEVDWNNTGFIIQGENEPESLYSLLENSLVPLYFDRNEKGVPVKWVAQMKNTIKIACSEFSTKRTVKDYFNKLYTAALVKQH